MGRGRWTAALTAAITASLIAPAIVLGKTKEAVPAIERTPLPTTNGGSNAATNGMGDTIVRMGIGLLVVVGLVLGVWYLMKRARRSSMPGMGSSGKGLVDVVATTPLGPTRFLHLVRVGGELILLGATDHTITAVARLTPDEAGVILDEYDGVDDLQAAFDMGTKRGDEPGGPPHDGASPLVDRLRSLTARR